MAHGLEEAEAGAIALPSSIVPRAYQIEMFEESMKKNVIVTMDTGSGKTQIAVLRVAAELDRCPSHKLVWLTVPTVALAQQQYTVMSHQLSAYPSRLLSGADNVHLWTSQEVWNAVLKDVRIVLSTSQVLVDALAHGFVKMKNIALLVFDEAHHIQASHPLNKMMQTFYHPAKTASGSDLPHILGLTASPIMGKDQRTVRKLEENLNAICIGPRRHLNELMQFVHRPELEKILISPESSAYPECLQTLFDTVTAIPLDDDPYIRNLIKDGRYESREKVRQFQDSGKSQLPHCLKQLKALCRRAECLFQDLGSWAAEYFVILCARRAMTNTSNSTIAFSLEEEERHFIAKVLRPFAARELPTLRDDPSRALAGKASQLLAFLNHLYNPSTNGIIFVNTRSSAAMLTKLISLHPLTAEKCRPLPFVGATFSGGRSDILDLADAAVQKEALRRFRRGACNLVIATSVLEEGIDINATNLVVRFDPPQNLRSYIQSRGRARKEGSRFVVFVSPQDPVAQNWDQLERRMREEYMKERNSLEEQERIAKGEIGERIFRVATTGAILTLYNAKSHLQNFCDHLPKIAYANSRPEYVFYGACGIDVVATIILPISVDPAVRVTRSAEHWQSERMASNDAAFEAYIKLYHAGLVNDNLLDPSRTRVDFRPEYKECGQRTVRTRLNAWIASLESDQVSSQPYRITLHGSSLQAPTMLLFIPTNMRQKIQLPLYLSPENELSVEISPFTEFSCQQDRHPAMSATRLLLRSLFANKLKDIRMWETAEFPYILVPESQRHRLVTWLSTSVGTIDVIEDRIFPGGKGDSRIQIQGLLRKKNEGNINAYKALRASYRIPTRDQNGALLPETTNRPEELHFELCKIPKNADFVHRDNKERQPQTKHYPIRYMQMDCLPINYSNFMLCFPSILHYIEIAIIAQRLADTVLAAVSLVNIDQVIDAISAPGSSGKGDYERLEFWGDCLLKYYVSIHLFTHNSLWHEGYLSKEKSRIVSNGRLCKAALDNDLDLYIQTAPFASSQWRPQSLADLELSKQSAQKSRMISSKTLADVVEALLGATDLDEPMKNDSQREQKSLEYLKIFLPELNWKPTQDNLSTIKSRVPCTTSVSFASFDEFEKGFLGYNFENRLLLVEALTHPSCPPTSSTSTQTSYERLEFLGDSILDKVVVSRLMKRRSPRYKTGFPPQLLTILRSIAVNADFLAYFCLGFSFAEGYASVTIDSSTSQCSTKTDTVERFLWQFMRHFGSREIHAVQDATRTRYLKLRNAVEKELSAYRTFPWALIARIASDKFFSDIVEAIIGAIFIDSGGNLCAVEGFLSRLGILRYLESLLDAVGRDGEFKAGSNNSGVMIMQPKMHLHELAQAKQELVDWADIKEGDNGCFRGSVKVGGVALGSVENATTRTAAVTIAADEAVKQMLALRMEE